MTPGERKRMLSALGLVDWQPRPDGALVARAAPAKLSDAEAFTPASPGEDSNHLNPTEETAHAPSRVSAETVSPESSADDEPQASAPLAATAETPAPPAKADDDTGATAGMDWDALESWLATRDHRGATRPVFGVGARNADVLIVGEAPGASEDVQGVPFVGRAGKLLDRMLFAIGCSRDTNVYITNICKFRPPNNRDPNPDEVVADWPVLERQIELMDPKLVVAVGRVAAQTLLDSKDNLGKLRGRLHRYPRRELDVLVTYHPAFLLRSPGQKAKAWDDLKQIARRIAQE